MTTFYPGSKMKQKVYGPDYKPPEQSEEVDLGQPKIYSVKGVETELYQMGALSIALNRQPVTLRKWETQGIIPKSVYVIGRHDNRAKRRLYTKDQLLGLRKLAWEEGILFPNGNGKWKDVNSTQFAVKAYKLFKELEG